MIDTNRMQHLLGVARFMYKHIEDYEENPTEQRRQEMWLLGYLHDIGREFDDIKGKLHETLGANICSNSNYKYHKEIEYHGHPEHYYHSIEMQLLNRADWHIDSYGNEVTTKERLKNIGKNHTTRGKIYQKAKIMKQLIDKEELNVKNKNNKYIKRFAWRNCTQEEVNDILSGKGIVCRNKNSTTTMYEHTKKYVNDTPYISASHKACDIYEWNLKKANLKSGIIMIDLTKVEEFYDFTTEDGLKAMMNEDSRKLNKYVEHYITTAKQEINIKYHIPAEACKIIFNPEDFPKIDQWNVWNKDKKELLKKYDNPELKNISNKVNNLLFQIRQELCDPVNKKTAEKLIEISLALFELTKDNPNKNWARAYRQTQL